MTREEQRIIREQSKRLSVEIRNHRKEYNLQYAHGYLYRFDGDFVYFTIPDIVKNEMGVLKTSDMIKPWVLNQLYWEIQQMNMEELLKQPKSFHIRGVFTVSDIYFENYRQTITDETFTQVVCQMMEQFNARVEQHRRILTDLSALKKEQEGYRISDLTRALVYIKDEEYEKALEILQMNKNEERIEHLDSKGKSAKEYAREYCLQRL